MNYIYYSLDFKLTRFYCRTFGGRRGCFRGGSGLVFFFLRKYGGINVKYIDDVLMVLFGGWLIMYYNADAETRRQQ
jgi:hypothetical protein